MIEISESINNAYIGLAILDSEFKIQYANASFSYMFEKENDEMMERHIADFLPDVRKDQAYTSSEARIIKVETPTKMVVRIIKVNYNDQYIVLSRKYVEYDYFVDTLKELSNDNHVYSRVLDAIHDGIFITDGKGIIKYMSVSFIKLSGIKKGQLLGKSVFDIEKMNLTSDVCTTKVFETKQTESKIINYVNGKNCLVTSTPVIIAGKLKSVVSIVRDLTELNTLRDMIEKANALTAGYQNKLKELELRSSHPVVSNIRSKEVKYVFEKAIKVSSLDTPVFLLGETGTGKDFLAEFIHNQDERKGNLIKINCGAIPAQLLESELFGYDPGAFTGAKKMGKAGLFELAKDGTVFLDEIGDMPIDLQVKLLSVIQDRVIYRLGGIEPIKVRARIIAATNADLDQLMVQGKFRSDLYYRLSVVELKLLPLRKRRDDIPQLALQFLEEFNHKYQKERFFTPRVIELLQSYHWPGNIRELKNTLEKTVIFAESDRIEMKDFDKKVFNTAIAADAKIYGTTLKTRMNIYEKSLIEEELEKHNTLKEAATALGIDLSTLVRKKQKYKI